MNSDRRFVVVLSALAALCTSTADAQMPGHGHHPPMPDQKFFVQCRIAGSEGQLFEFPLEIPSPAMPADVDQVLNLPAPYAPVRVKQYLPQALLEQNVVPTTESNSVTAVQISIDGPSQSFQRWLIADDRDRNRLTSLIGTWRYMAVADKAARDELESQFREELTRPPRLVVSQPDGTGAERFDVKASETHELEQLACTVRVVEFYPHFGFDEKTAKPVNQSDKRLNPAVLVELSQDEKKEERWVFAKFPTYKAGDGDSIPLRVQLDCPIDQKRTAPDFVVVTVGNGPHEVWSRFEEKTEFKPAKVNEKFEVPGSQYSFRVAQFVPKGRLVEEYQSGRGSGSTAALRLETKDAAGKLNSVWLELGKPKIVDTADGRIVLSFGPQHAPAADENLHHGAP